MIKIEVDDADLASALVELKFLDPLVGDDDAAVQRALNEMLRVLCRGIVQE